MIDRALIVISVPGEDYSHGLAKRFKHLAKHTNVAILFCQCFDLPPWSTLFEVKLFARSLLVAVAAQNLTLGYFRAQRRLSAAEEIGDVARFGRRLEVVKDEYPDVLFATPERTDSHPGTRS